MNTKKNKMKIESDIHGWYINSKIWWTIQTEKKTLIDAFNKDE